MINTKLGFYKVKNFIFYNKLQAILYANPTKADIEWNFNKELLDKFNWSIEPTQTLSELYKIRAQQIREQFDYVILMISGGADSTNVLYSFFDNNIHVDEIIAGAPLSGLKNWNINLADKSANNIITETFVAQLPLLKNIASTHPNIKITVHDYFEDILKIKTDEWIYESSSHWLHFSGTTRHSLEKFNHIRTLAESGKRIGVVYGIDKPFICREQTGNLYTVIMDSAVNVVTPHFKEKYPNVESVLYYYSPDLPELMIKQAHDVCNWIYKPENSVAKSFLWDLAKSFQFNSDPIRGSNYQRRIIPCIYPRLGDVYSYWQAHKQGPGFRGGLEIDSWVLKLHSNEKFVQMVNSDLNLFIKDIDSKYMLAGDKMNGFKRFTNYWKIGHENNFIANNTQDINMTNSELII